MPDRQQHARPSTIKLSRTWEFDSTTGGYWPVILPPDTGVGDVSVGEGETLHESWAWAAKAYIPKWCHFWMAPTNSLGFDWHLCRGRHRETRAA